MVHSRTRLRVAVLAMLLSGLTLLRAFTSNPDAFVSKALEYLYALPVVIAAPWFGLSGSLAAVVPALVGLAAVNGWRFSPAQGGEALDLVLIAIVTGLLAERERLQTRRLEEARAELERANAELRKNMESLRRVERMAGIGQLAAGLAHEIRNPLASIEGAADILQIEEIDPQTREEFGEVIKKEAHRLRDLLTRLLEYARPRPPAYRPAGIEPLLETVARLMRLQSRQAQVTIETAVERDLPPVPCDPEQIQQVLINLALNAVQSMSEGGTVSITAQADAGGVRIKVRDTGVGIPPEHVPQLFDPFFTTKPTGTGLGLPIAQQVVAQHRGTIEVQSKVGEGTVFTVFLPFGHEDLR